MSDIGAYAGPGAGDLVRPHRPLPGPGPGDGRSESSQGTKLTISYSDDAVFLILTDDYLISFKCIITSPMQIFL